MFGIKKAVFAISLLICFSPQMAYSHSSGTLHIESSGNLQAEIFIQHIVAVNPEISANYLEELINAYIDIGSQEGINHDIAIAQMILETGYLRFGNDVKIEQNNFCGLGATGGGNPGNSFATIEEGVHAHIQHLKAYGSTADLISPLVDPRFKYVTRGIAPQIFDLTGKWATDPSYGQKIAKIISQMYLKINMK